MLQLILGKEVIGFPQVLRTYELTSTRGKYKAAVRSRCLSFTSPKWSQALHRHADPSAMLQTAVCGIHNDLVARSPPQTCL